MAEQPRPAYREKILHHQGDAAARPSDELFFHLGYWPEPASAGHTWADLKLAQRRLNDRLLELADIGSARRILDVGCGVGGTLAEIAGRRPGAGLTGLNIDAAQLAVAQHSLSALPIEWVQADGCHLPFADRTFDRLLAIECIFHFASRQQFFAEAARVLRPGGRLVLSDFVVSEGLRHTRGDDTARAAEIDAGMIDVVGPFPEFWHDDGDDTAVASAAGFTLAAHQDASQATLPSYRCFLPVPPLSDLLERRTMAAPVDRAMAILEWLQANRHVGVALMAFTLTDPS